MKWNLSKTVLAIEFLLIVLPVSALFVLGLHFLLSAAIQFPGIRSIVSAVIGVASAMSIIAIYILGYRLIKDKSLKTTEQPALWLLIILGALIVTSAIISELIPPSTPYLLLWNIREDLELFILGAPLIIVAGHIYYESNKR